MMNASGLIDPESIALVSVDDARAQRVARQMDPRVQGVYAPTFRVLVNGEDITDQVIWDTEQLDD